MDPLNLYIKCSRLVFNVEPSEVWDECDEFEKDLRQLYESVLCTACKKLIEEPVNPKKNHFSCQHRVCLDCIGKKRATQISCKLCSDYTLFEKNQQTKIVLGLFKELCGLIQNSWIYDYVQRRVNHDTGQTTQPSLMAIIDAGLNYGQVSIILDETSSDETSSSSFECKEPVQSETYSQRVISNVSPLSSIKPSNAGFVQSSPEPQYTIISEPVIPPVAAAAPIPIVSAPMGVPLQHIMHYQPQLGPPQMPSTSKLTPNLQQPTATFVKYQSPMIVTSIAGAASLGAKPVMSTVKVQPSFASPTPTIYSVMYTGSGNKITLKRKPPDEAVLSPVTNNVSCLPFEKSDGNLNTCSTFQMTIMKTENSNFKKPPIQMTTQTLNPPPAPVSIAQGFSPSPGQQTSNNISNQNDPQKRRGCRCGNATAAPGKLTCCGQRCPCYVESKACMDCKCKGCRNPHYVDGHKKVNRRGTRKLWTNNNSRIISDASQSARRSSATRTAAELSRLNSTTNNDGQGLPAQNFTPLDFDDKARGTRPSRAVVNADERVKHKQLHN